MKRVFLLFAGMALVVIAGCSTLSTVNPRAMTVSDVTAMTTEGVAADVIMRQIEATHSRFELTPDQIIQLKKAGVADEVLKAMIESGTHPGYQNSGYPYAPYSYWYDPYDPLSSWYWGPYGSPYGVWRQPGMIGRFYSDYPFSGGTGYRNEPYRDDNEYNNEHPDRPGTGEPSRSDRNRDPQPERRK